MEWNFGPMRFHNGQWGTIQCNSVEIEPKWTFTAWCFRTLCVLLRHCVFHVPFLCLFLMFSFVFTIASHLHNSCRWPRPGWWRPIPAQGPDNRHTSCWTCWTKPSPAPRNYTTFLRWTPEPPLSIPLAHVPTPLWNWHKWHRTLTNTSDFVSSAYSTWLRSHCRQKYFFPDFLAHMWLRSDFFCNNINGTKHMEPDLFHSDLGHFNMWS